MIVANFETQVFDVTLRGALRRLFAAALLTCVWLAGSNPLFAQMRLDAEAYVGSPFGVGRITLQSGGDFRLNRPLVGRGRIGELARRVIEQTGGGEAPPNLDTAQMSLVERQGRIYYPVFEKRERPILREFVAVPTQSTLFFLFEGTAPLDLTVYAPDPQAGRITPVQDSAAHARLLRDWWRDYSAAAAANAAREYPPMVEAYLVRMLAGKLRLPLPDRPADRQSSWIGGEVKLLAGTESARLDMVRSIFAGDVSTRPATERLPEQLPAPRLEPLSPPPSPIEPIAMRVPVECLYVRFGSFSNFLWLRHRLEEWGGEVRDVISERGLEYGLNRRMEHQLGMPESGALAELLGDQVIADVALLGTDVFLNEGAALGVLLQAKNNLLLSTGLGQQRSAAAKSEKGAKLETVKIAGHAVSFLSSPDNSLRSFYVVDGDYHLITTSRTIAEWFLTTGAGKHDSLGESDAFRLARTTMPVARGDTLFAYLSPEFFHNLLSPHYQIEIKRRLRSAVEMELFEIAQLAARGARMPADTVDELVAGEFLPRAFGQRPDGSRLENVDGKLIDSQRGGRGTFIPVPDAEVKEVSAEELADYRRFAEAYVADWGTMDPIVAAVGRQALPEGKLERVTVDVEAAPLSRQHIERLNQWLGPPTDRRLAPVAGDVVSFEAVLRGGSFFAGEEHLLFGALRDADPVLASDPRTGLLGRLLAARLEGLQGYIGAWPNVGFLRFLGGSSDILPDSAGYSRLRTGLWRRQYDGFTLMSFHPEILDYVSRQLRFEQAERPAQIRFRAEDLAHSKLAPMLNAYGYRQSREIMRGNAAFMNMLADQLHVPPAECRATAERLLDAKFVAPLGGDYKLKDLPGGAKLWVATALEAGDGRVPADYQFPALNWLRGIQAEVRVQNAKLAVHGEFIMPVETKPAATPALPALPFGLGNLTAPKPKPNGNNTDKPKAAPKPSAPSSRREF